MGQVEVQGQGRCICGGGEGDRRWCVVIGQW